MTVMLEEDAHWIWAQLRLTWQQMGSDKEGALGTCSRVLEATWAETKSKHHICNVVLYIGLVLQYISLATSTWLQHSMLSLCRPLNAVHCMRRPQRTIPTSEDMTRFFNIVALLKQCRAISR